MLEFIGAGSHYCVHQSVGKAFIGTVAKYLGLWSFSPRTPFGHSVQYVPTEGEQEQLKKFIASLS